MIVSPSILPLGNNVLRLAWSGTAGAVVRAFVNGLLVFGPAAVATASKTLDVAVSDPCTLEVHENAENETVPGTQVPLERRPLLWWSSVSGVDSYLVQVGGNTLAIVVHEPSALHHQHQLLQDVRVDGGPGWVEFEIVAQTATGRVSSGTVRHAYVPGAPLEPEDVEVTGVGGEFDVEVSLP